jgi:hypothetical protein
MSGRAFGPTFVLDRKHLSTNLFHARNLPNASPVESPLFEPHPLLSIFRVHFQFRAPFPTAGRQQGCPLEKLSEKGSRKIGRCLSSGSTIGVILGTQPDLWSSSDHDRDPISYQMGQMLSRGDAYTSGIEWSESRWLLTLTTAMF